MSYGTCYFVSREAAIKYYREYEHDPARAVAIKLSEGSIQIGKPILRAGQTLVIIDDGTRYAVEESQSAAPDKCMKPGCNSPVYSGFEYRTCYAHHLVCSVRDCAALANLFSPAGQLCAAHYAPIRTERGYPSFATIRAAWSPTKIVDINPGMTESALVNVETHKVQTPVSPRACASGIASCDSVSTVQVRGI